MYFSILIDSHFYEPISIIKSELILFPGGEWTEQNRTVHLPSNKSCCYFWKGLSILLGNSSNKYSFGTF